MPHLRLDDDGQSVTLDLHGARVAEALDLARAAVAQAASHGRRTVRLIHGTSTADRGADRTIKGALHQALDDGDFDRAVTSSFRGEGTLTLGLHPAASPAPGRLRLADLRR
ncbi:Smr/MutS family protein [Rubrivirga sp.]|uniref:Smr/MutS family protein n=1 Tax=Rubrivirga sp. TaxID=1885344 RepID=UPI003B525321